MKLPNALACLLACAALNLLSPTNAAFPSEQWEYATPESQGYTRESVDAAMLRLKEIVGKDGTSQTMLVSNGYAIWSGNDVTSKRFVWSCTKSFTSACLGLLWDDGKCLPSDLASKYLPELAEHYPDVTLEHLATFTSGLNVKSKSLEVLPPLYAPGTAMRYSRESDILALILTKIAGEPLHDLFMRRIGTPLGMTADGFEWRSAYQSGGVAVNGGFGTTDSGVAISAECMARFGWLLANGGQWRGEQLISARYIEYATAHRVPAALPPHDAKGWYANVLPGRYGLNWWVNGAGPTNQTLWPSLSDKAFAAQGNNNNICIIEPERKLVLVRLAADKIIDVARYDEVFSILLNQ